MCANTLYLEEHSQKTLYIVILIKSCINVNIKTDNFVKVKS